MSDDVAQRMMKQSDDLVTKFEAVIGDGSVVAVMDASTRVICNALTMVSVELREDMIARMFNAMQRTLTMPEPPVVKVQ